MFYKLYVCEYYKKLIEHITKTIEEDKIKDIDLINCLNDMINDETANYFLNGVFDIINKIKIKYKITKDLLDCIFDVYLKYMFDIELVLYKSEFMSHKQYLILEECKWILKPSNTTHWHWSAK